MEVFATELTGLVSCGRFADPTLRTVIELWKYKQASCLERVVEELMMRAVVSCKARLPWKEEERCLVVPMPADERTVLARGFQHTEPLARIVYRQLLFWGKNVNLLRRKRSVVKQARIQDHETRKQNVAGVYAYRDGLPDLAGAACVLVDDVYTSGASMREAARVLKAHGAGNVYGFVLARGG